MADINIYKVKLIAVRDPRLRVIFENTPSLSEQGSVTYSAVTPVHMPGSVQVYKNTESRQFSIGAKFIARTSEEARINKVYLQTLRSFRFPWFGTRSSTLTQENVEARRERAALQERLNQPDIFDSEFLPTGGETTTSSIQTRISMLDQLVGFEMLGAPPEVLYLYGYSSTGQDGRTSGIPNLNRIPVVMTNLSIDYPEDVDYIPCSDGSGPFPVAMDVTIALVETHSPAEFARFSLNDYKNGKLPNF